MHEIDDYFDTHGMRSIDEFFELVGSAEPRRNAEEIRTVVAKRSVVGMLDDSHNLNGFVP